MGRIKVSAQDEPGYAKLHALADGRSVQEDPVEFFVIIEDLDQDERAVFESEGFQIEEVVHRMKVCAERDGGFLALRRKFGDRAVTWSEERRATLRHRRRSQA